MASPNFLLIGAMRSGTTALYTFLGQHPEIFMSPRKEPNYFAFPEGEAPELVEGSTSVSSAEEYHGLFEGVADEVRIGEASHSYLYYPGAAERIRQRLGDDVRILCILRDPVLRAFSHFMFHTRNGREDAAEFGTALATEDERIRSGGHFGHYRNRGLYARQLQRYFDVFPRDSIRVHLYDDLANRPLWLMRDLFEFLDVDPGFEPDVSIRHNPSGVPRRGWLHALLVNRNPVKRRVQPVLPRGLYRMATRIRDRNLIRPELDPGIRAELAETYRSDVAAVEDLIERDLSAWLG